MAIKPKCLTEIADKLGRPLKQSEINGIEERLQRHLMLLARGDVDAFRQMPLSDRLAAAAKSASEEVIAEATRKAQNTARNIVATERGLSQMKELSRGQAQAKGLERMLDQTDSYIKGTARDYFSRMLDTIQAQQPKFFELVENRPALRAFLGEIFGEKTGDDVAAKGAKAWLDTAEAMRVRSNAAGTDTGKLSYGYVPQPHNQAKILKVGAEKWIDDTLPTLDRRRYYNENGSLMDEGQLRTALGSVYETLSTGGLNQLEPGSSGREGALANRRAEHRILHFAGADAYLQYMDAYGKGTVFEALQKHVGEMSRDIGLTETFGPNASGVFRTLNDTAIIADGKQKKTGPFFVSNDERWNALTGYYAQAIDPKWAEIGSGIRNFTSATKLQGNLLSSFADVPTYVLTAHYNNLPIVSTLVSAFRDMFHQDADRLEFANRVGLVSDSIIHDMNRWAGDNIAQGWTAKLANTTQKVSLMNRWTDALKRSFSVAYMGAMGRVSRGTWEAIDATDRGRMEANGIDKETFDVWRKATPEDWRESKMLTPDSIRAIDGVDDFAKNKAISKLLGMIIEESDYAVISPDLDTKARVQSTGQRGTFNGELGRALYLFKSFPMAMVSRHLSRINEMDSNMAKLGYGAALMVGLTGFGALSIQAKELVAGRNPRDMTGKDMNDLSLLAKFWGAAFAQGGGAGVFGDMLYTGVGGNAKGGQPNWTNLAGPVLGTAFDAANATIGNLGQLTAGQKTNFGSEAMRLARSNAPFLNLWYAKSALDHAMFHEWQEQLSPGYLSRMQSQAAKDYNSSYYWQPGFHAPAKPDLSTALGGR